MPAYCNDAYFYVYIAGQITEGNLIPLLTSLGINIYPLILIAGHWLGFTWTGGGVVWGIAVGSLTVLPLYGWLRRIGNDRLALAGLPPVHCQPKFIELSMEPIRDSTFWFFFVLCLYCIWRAMEAMKFRWCLSAGIALTLAIHTRTEGWFLLIPLAWWLLARLVESPGQRWRTATGSLGLFAMIPLFLVAFNLTLLRAEPEWRVGKLKHFVTGWEWFCTHVQPILGPGDDPVPPAPADPIPANPAPVVATPVPAPAPARSESRGNAPSGNGIAGRTPCRRAGPGEVPLSSPADRPIGTKVKNFFQQLHSTFEPLHYFLILAGIFRRAASALALPISAAADFGGDGVSVRLDFALAARHVQRAVFFDRLSGRPAIGIAGPVGVCALVPAKTRGLVKTNRRWIALGGDRGLRGDSCGLDRCVRLPREYPQSRDRLGGMAEILSGVHLARRHRSGSQADRLSYAQPNADRPRQPF